MNAFTINERLTRPLVNIELTELKSEKLVNGDEYTLLKNRETGVYYLALNNYVFLITFSDMTAYMAYAQAVK